MSELKTLATCTPSEFLRQTNRIKKAAEKWLKVTDIMKIRNDKPVLISVDADASEDEKAKVFEKNKEILREKGMENFSKIYDAISYDHPEETLELLALCCFIEPEQVDEHPMRDYLNAVSSLINDSAVINFFTSLVSLEQMNTFNA